MKHAWLAVFILALSAGTKENPVKQVLNDFAGGSRYEAPPGWETEKADTAVDPSLRLALGVDLIKVRLFGGRGSRYAGPADYLKGFEATTMGRPPEKVRPAKVAGVKTWIYRHGYPVNLGDPDVSDPRPPALAREEFCIIPRGKKFLVLSWAHESPLPDPAIAGEKAWKAFLTSFAVPGPRLPYRQVK